MVYCINPWCLGGEERLNPEDASFCQYCGTDLLINNRYRLLQPLRKLSLGDNYQIFKIIDITNDEQSVLKTQIVRVPLIDKLFKREIELLLKLNDPAVPKGKDSFSVMILNPERRELPCLVMEYIKGDNLEEWIKKNGKIGSDSSPIEAKTKALDWLYQLTNILSSIHSENVIHRDIKPSNIMLRADAERGKELALIDFGIARLSNPTANQPTPTTLVEGSSGYTPSEVKKGQAKVQSDFFALGRTFVYLLTNKHPHEYEEKLPTWNKDTVFPNSQLIQLINDLMKEGYEHRPKSTTEILQRIEEIRAKELTTTASPPPPYHLLRDVLAGIGAVVILVLAGIGLSSIIPPKPTKPPKPTEQSTQTPTSPSELSIQLKPPEELISAGDKSVYKRSLRGNYTKLKEDGISAFANGDYPKAEKLFQQFRNDAEQEKDTSARTDPEVLIFLNNAKVRQKKDQPIYTIAVAAPITNVNDGGRDEPFSQGQQILFGVAQAQTEAIRQKINLEVVIANDRNLSNQAVSVAEKLTQMHNQSILAVIGHYTSDVTCNALKKVYSQQQIVVISPSSTRTNLRQSCGGAFFRTTSSAEIEAKALVNYIVQLKNSNQIREPKIAAFYHFEDTYTKDIFEKFQSELRSRLKVEISDEFKVDLANSAFDVKQELSRIRSANILALFPDGTTNNNTAYLNAFKVLDENFNNTITIETILGSNPLLQYEAISKAVANSSNKLVKKLVLATDWHLECGKREFVNNANLEWGGGINRLTAQSYEAVQVLFTTLKNLQAKQTDVSKNTLRDAIQNLDSSPVLSDVFEESFGIRTISFDPKTGDRKEIKNRILLTPDGNTQFKRLNSGRCTQ
jgi:eukaryotic-like serine/threonine-protein kinase